MKHQKNGEYKKNHIDIIKYEDGIEQLVKYAVCKKLIPVFGAGFTAGCQSVNGIVPNGQRATEGMRNLILNSASCTLQKDDVEEMDFSEISDLFFECVSRDERATYFEDFYADFLIAYRFRINLNFILHFVLKLHHFQKRNKVCFR